MDEDRLLNSLSTLIESGMVICPRETYDKLVRDSATLDILVSSFKKQKYGPITIMEALFLEPERTETDDE